MMQRMEFKSQLFRLLGNEETKITRQKLLADKTENSFKIINDQTRD